MGKDYIPREAAIIGLAASSLALLFIHFLFCIIAGGEDDFDAATSQTETLTAPGAAEGENMSTYSLLRAILIVLILDNILFTLGIIAWMILGKEK